MSLALTAATITTFGELDERSLAQLTRCAEAGDANFAVLCADHHPGYSQPIGGVVAYRSYRASTSGFPRCSTTTLDPFASCTR